MTAYSAVHLRSSVALFFLASDADSAIVPRYTCPQELRRATAEPDYDRLARR